MSTEIILWFLLGVFCFGFGRGVANWVLRKIVGNRQGMPISWPSELEGDDFYYADAIKEITSRKNHVKK